MPSFAIFLNIHCCSIFCIITSHNITWTRRLMVITVSVMSSYGLLSILKGLGRIAWCDA